MRVLLASGAICALALVLVVISGRRSPDDDRLEASSESPEMMQQLPAASTGHAALRSAVHLESSNPGISSEGGSSSEPASSASETLDESGSRSQPTQMQATSEDRPATERIESVTRRIKSASVEPLSHNDCSLATDIRKSATIVDVRQQEAIMYSGPGGDFVRLQEVLSSRICAGRQGTVNMSPAIFDLAVVSETGTFGIHVGEGWIGDGASVATLRPSEYVEISEILNQRRLAPGPNLTREEFDLHYGQVLWATP